MTEKSRPSDGALEAKAAACRDYLRRRVKSDDISVPQRNVVGIGIGPKVRDGKVVEPESIRLYVERKLKRADIPAEHVLPDKIGNVFTDVTASGRFRCSSMPAIAPGEEVIQPGTSCGVKFGRCGDGATGTVGAIVARGDKRYILSSAHVLGRSNGFLRGAPVLYPGPIELPLLAGEQGHGMPGMMSGAMASLPEESVFHRAKLSEFEPLSLDGDNEMDAAIAEITKGKFTPEIADIGPLSCVTPFPPVRDMRVTKSGFGTKLTTGRVTNIGFEAVVEFPLGSMGFSHQILIEGDNNNPFAWEGDSGSLVVTQVQFDDGRPATFAVAMIVGFALPESADGPATSFCVATDLSRVLNKLNVELWAG